jgi:ribosome-associated toxin RatA of RatAB toxin-antitoxin module
MPAARHEIEIDVPPDAIMGVITDFSAYPQFLPEMESCEVLRSSPDEWDVRFTVKVVKRLRYTLRLRKVNEHQVRWSLVDGVFKSNEGGWDLTPLSDGSRTHVVYFIDLQVGMFVPSNIMKSLVERSLPETVSRFKGEAERRS